MKIVVGIALFGALVFGFFMVRKWWFDRTR